MSAWLVARGNKLARDAAKMMCEPLGEQGKKSFPPGCPMYYVSVAM